MELTKIFVDLISAIAWPGAVVWIVFLFRSEIKNLTSIFSDSAKFSFKIAGQELSMEKELKREIVKESVEKEESTKEGYIKKESFTKRMEVLIPFLEARLGGVNN